MTPDWFSFHYYVKLVDECVRGMGHVTVMCTDVIAIIMRCVLIPSYEYLILGFIICVS